MGVEYRISCPTASHSRMQDFLRQSGGVPSKEFPDQIEFRFPHRAADQMPDAMVIFEPQGLYFCDHGGDREQVAVLFRRLIDAALALADSSDRVVVTSL